MPGSKYECEDGFNKPVYSTEHNTTGQNTSATRRATVASQLDKRCHPGIPGTRVYNTKPAEPLDETSEVKSQKICGVSEVSVPDI